jgi:hypothetical protein
VTRGVALALLLAVVACSGSHAPATASTTHVVPADLRDVERDGEGLVVTTFGAYPDRQPDWTRASAVLGLLREVWDRSKSAAPGLPADGSGQVDQAIADVDTALGADQERAAYAANSVGLAVPKLFGYYRPDTPIEIVRMDAVFRQVGLDAHFGHSTALAQSLALLKSDWSAMRGRVAARAPTCTRVGGTATVTDDIEQSLSVLDAALASSDLGAAEQETENGATEIDTLELLFDCPRGSELPTSGLGSACRTDADCAANAVCDMANAGGRCAPDPMLAQVGTPCTSTIDCGPYERSACNTEAGDNYPGGYCSLEPCDDVQTCPPGGTCVAVGGETPSCLAACATDADCRQAEGYVCQLFVTTPPTGFGPTDHACAFPCTRDADCQSPLRCDVAAGRCTP